MTELEWITGAVQRVVLWMRPAGGQAVARRNAWASLVAANQRRSQRLEAEHSVEAVLAARRRHAAAAVEPAV